MSDQMHDEMKLSGDYSPDRARSHLERLSASLGFLRRLARPEAAGDGAPSPDLAQLSFGLELLAEQVRQVLGAQSGAAPGAVQPHGHGASFDASAASREQHDTDADVFPETDPQILAEPVVFGVTMDQFDALDRLIRTILAHGDVVSASGMADFAQGTLPMVGHAIFDGAMAVREILDQMEMQTLPEPAHRHAGVAEKRMTYATAALALAPAERRRLH